VLPTHVLGRRQDLFDDPFLTRLSADRQLFHREEEHGRREMQVRNDRSGRPEQAAQGFPHGFGGTSINGADRMAQVGVGAAGITSSSHAW